MKGQTEEMTAGTIAGELGCHRQTAWRLLSGGKIRNARKVYARLWVAPRGEVLRYKEQMQQEAAHRPPLIAA